MRFAWTITTTMCLLGSGCAGDGGDDGGETGSESESSTSSSTNSTTSSESTSTSDSGSSESSGDSAADSSTGPVYECFDYLEDECVGECAPLHGQPFVPEGDMSYCLGEPVYLGCHDASRGCAEVETTACDPDGTAFYFPSACIPDSFLECDPPTQDFPPCG